jgi:lipopolysaccharide export system permease protein
MFREILSTTGLVMAVLLGLAVFIEFVTVTQLDDVGTGDYGIPQALLFALLKLPNLAHIMLPMAALLGALLGLGGLANHSELVVIRGAGVSQIRLAGAVMTTGVVLSLAVMTTGVVLSLLALVLGENVGPPLENYARQFRAQAKHVDSGMAIGSSAWLRDGDTFLNISRQTDDDPLGGVYLYKMHSAGQLTSIARADSTSIGEANQLVLSNFAETAFVDQGVTSRQLERLSRSSNLNPDLIGLAVVRPSSLTGVALYRYVRYLRLNELDASRYEAAFWGRIANAVAVTPMCILALPFVFGRLQRSGAGARMIFGLIIGLAYFLASRGLADGGQVYGLNAVLVAWMPTTALAVVTVVALARTRYAS